MMSERYFQIIQRQLFKERDRKREREEVKVAKY